MSGRMESDKCELNGLFSCVISIVACFSLSVIYVASLYVWNSPHSRDHPSTIKRRFFSVFVMMFISPLFVFFCISNKNLEQVTIWEILGLRWNGIIVASIIPLLLTMILFLGPLSMQAYSGMKKRSYGSNYVLLQQNQNLIWLRNYIVAPLSEEFTFRACMLPILLKCFHPTTAIIINPLFFGVAHLHHIMERMKSDIDLKIILFQSFFQFAYTTIFGLYSAYLFVRTGHMTSVFVAHAFCNLMGFPEVSELQLYKSKQRNIIIGFFIAGFISWCILLTPLTRPNIYSNNVFDNFQCL